MNCIKSTLVVAAMAMLFISTGNAQEQEDSFLLDLTAFTIKYGHGSQFVDGVKKWKKCYQDNGGENKWNMWHRVQGNENVYVVSGRMDNWAEMDKEDPAGMACGAIALQSIIPHIKSQDQNIARSMPKISRSSDLPNMSLIWSTGFKVKNHMAFMEVIEDVTSTIKGKEGDERGYWYRVMGGTSMDYFVSSPYENFAALDKEEDSVWEVYKNVHGEKKTKEIREKFMTSYSDIWSYIYTLEEELSMP
ncbi:MAG: hypothetical protein WA775_13900 [Psychroserpens sp.]|uniref:hypothetical protein n=1 Tax=Psychroserpens sp. TaxID=2020870 RepID=UPI003C774446